MHNVATASSVDALFALKRLWGETVLSEGEFQGDRILALCKDPAVKEHPIGRVIAALLLKRLGLSAAPFVPMHPLMPCFESCQLALLWSIAGEAGASAFASKLLPLLDFPELWCKEWEFSQGEAAESIALLRRAFGDAADSAPQSKDPFFRALLHHLPHWTKASSLPHRVVDPELGFVLQRSDHFSGAVTLAGENTSLGAFRAGDVAVRSFGPQILPFSDPKGFGILRLPDSQPIERWAAVAGMPEVWMETHVRFEREEMALSVRFLGQKVEKQVHFSFYIKAPECHIEGERFLPRTLQRYQGEARPALFGNKVKIESFISGKMELIPLAGEGNFWGCDFLLAFEVPPFDGRGEYRLYV